MDLSLFNNASKYFTQEVIENEFLNILQKKGYIQSNRVEFCGGFLKKLYNKKYIDKKTYNNILEYYGKKKIFKKSKGLEGTNKPGGVKKLEGIIENRLMEMVEEKIEETIENETYDIIDEDYIDYENIQIDGVEYYLHKETFNIVDVKDYRDMGYWDKEKCAHSFIDRVCSERHSSRILSG